MPVSQPDVAVPEQKGQSAPAITGWMLSVSAVIGLMLSAPSVIGCMLAASVVISWMLMDYDVIDLVLIGLFLSHIVCWSVGGNEIGGE